MSFDIEKKVEEFDRKIRANKKNRNFSYKNEQCVFTPKYRPFLKETYDYFQPSYSQNICHRLPISNIGEIMACAMNNFEYSTSLFNLIELLLIRKEFVKEDNGDITVYRDNDRETATEYEKEAENDLYERAMNKYNEIDFGRFSDDNLIALEHIFFYLNNAPMNLRNGNESWNKSIRNGYDPVAWKYDKGKFNIDDDLDSYFFSSFFREEHSFIPTLTPIFLYTGIDKKKKPFMYSSNNTFSLSSGRSVDPCCDKIFYKNFIFNGVNATYSNGNYAEFPIDDNRLPSIIENEIDDIIF